MTINSQKISNDKRSWLGTIGFLINIAAWYGFTVFSTIYSKKFLNITSDAHTLTIASFVYAAVLKLIWRPKLADLIGLLHNKDYLSLGLFNIGTILMTNIGMNETSVSVTYMVKASEPLFVLILSYYLLEETQPVQVLVTLLPICLGVSLIVYGAAVFNLVGFSCAFAANIASASRNVFYKTKLSENNDDESPFVAFLNVGFISFILYVPFYLLQAMSFLVISPDSNASLGDFISSVLLGYDALKLLALGSFFNFLYNLFSLKVLSNVAPISHSVINIMKRVFIVVCSTLVFTTQITSLQWIGMICADLGVFSYSIAKLRYKALKIMISGERKILYKKLLLSVVALILLASCFLPVDSQIFNDQQKLIPVQENFDDPSMRALCIKKIREEIRSIARPLIPSQRRAHLLDVSVHRNYGDSFIWAGQEKLLSELGVQLSNRLHIGEYRIHSRTYLNSAISPEDTVLFQGGGNFGDLYRQVTRMRDSVMQALPNNKFVIFPQTINYRRESNAMYDQKIYSKISDLTIMARSKQSYEFALQTFTKNRVLLVPDMAFMIGNLKPKNSPDTDILVFRRLDQESSFNGSIWRDMLNEKLTGKFTFKIYDWPNFTDVREPVLAKLPWARVDMCNKILSRGRLIITDRLHVSIFSLLLGRPHVILNDRYKKVQNTRDTAFGDKPECTEENVNGYYAESIDEAIDKAIALLANDSPSNE